MSFILVPKHGEELQVNGWNWRPTLELLRREGLLDSELYGRMDTQGRGGEVDGELAMAFADVVDRKLAAMKAGSRMRADLTVTDGVRPNLTFPPTTKCDVDVNELYSAAYEWLLTFRDFCRTSGGFTVV